MIVNAFLDIMDKGGYPFMIPLVALSIASLAVICERAFALWRRSLLSEGDRRRALDLACKKDHQGLLAYFKARKSYTALLLADAAEMMGTGSILFEEALEHSADKNMDLLNDRFWILRGISHIGPIIGLLGTVVGLAISFSTIGKIGLNQQSVASGISMALITTIAGLTIALPTIVAEYYLKSVALSRFRSMRALLHDLAIRYGRES